MKELWLLSAIFVAFILAQGPGQSGVGDLGCLEELELPRFAVANRVPSGGEVRVSVLIGQNGEPVNILAESTEASLTKEVEYHLRERAVYDPACSGRTVNLRFTFKVEGEPVPSPSAKIWFRPPNHFVIKSQRQSPILDHQPLDPDNRR